MKTDFMPAWNQAPQWGEKQGQIGEISARAPFARRFPFSIFKMKFEDFLVIVRLNLLDLGYL